LTERAVRRSNPSRAMPAMMHCHILEHAEAGMMTEIHVGDR